MLVSVLINDLLELFQKQSGSYIDFANKFSDIYDNFAQTCIPKPVTVGRPPILAQIVASGAATLEPDTFINSLNIGLASYWLGVPLLAGGLTTAYLGASSLASTLYSMIGIPKPAEVAADILGNALWAATQQVQYVIPPLPPAFLV